MNKNRKLRKAGAVGLSVVMAMTLGMGGTMVYGANVQEKLGVNGVQKLVSEEIQKKLTEAEKEETTANDNAVYKEEVVYAYTDAKGTVNNITVSDWLKNSAGKSIVNDVSDLSDVENVKGDETFSTGENGTIAWDTKDSDIYYQGTSNSQLPVGMEVTYYLDGKEVQPSELVGKSGKFEMHVKYTNQSKKTVDVDEKEIEVNTPFAMVTAMILPEENFSNVTVDNGKILSDGNRTIAIGMGLPGLEESLDLDKDLDVELPDSFVMTADVTDFKMDSTFTVATSELLNDLGLDDVDNMEDLKDSLDELADASIDLVKGTKDLSDGVKTLKDKTGDFTDGLDELSDGISQMSDGAGTLQSGTKEYTNGVGTLSDGVKQYVSGAATLADGVIDYTNGAKKLQKGIQTLSDSTKELPSGLQTLSDGINSYGAGVNELVSEENMTALTNGTSALVNGIGTVNSGLTSVQSGVTAINQSLTTLEASYSNNEQLIKSLKGIMATMEDGEQKTQLSAVITNLEKVTATQKAGIAQLKASTASDSQLGQGVATLVSNTSENGALLKGAKSLDTAANKMSAGGEQLRKAFPSLSQGAEQLSKAGKKLPGAMKELTSGAKKLVSNNSKLQKGAKQLKTSGKTLNEGASKLTKNSDTLVSGVKAMKEATEKLLTGSNQLKDGGNKLADGVDELYNGSVDLKDGMKKFNEEGIEELTSTFDEDLQDVLDRVNAVSKAGKSYNSFSGISENMDGSVKFVIKSDDIK